MFVINKQLPVCLEGSHTQPMMSTHMNQTCIQQETFYKLLFFGRNVNQFHRAALNLRKRDIIKHKSQTRVSRCEVFYK